MKGKITLFEHWERQKNYERNNRRLIVIISWCFYKTFNENTDFFNKRFWFKIILNKEYYYTKFPIKWSNKIFEFLRENKYSFSIFDVIEKKYLRLIDEYNWWKYIE